jgi:hypothetical protein
VNSAEAMSEVELETLRRLDTKDWSGWHPPFADDFISDTSGAGGKTMRGADAFVAFVRKTLGARVTVHQVHAPELELTSPTTARGIWALEDLIRFAPGLGFRGYGHYHETYAKRDGQWRIQSSKLTRLREDLVTPLFSLCISGLIRRRRA